MREIPVGWDRENPRSYFERERSRERKREKAKEKDRRIRFVSGLLPLF